MSQNIVLSLDVPEDLYDDMVLVFGAAKPEDIENIALRALKKAYGEARIQRLAAEKRAEVEAEAQRLNVELGLTKE